MEYGKLIELLNEYGKTSKCGPFEDYRIESATDYNSSYLVLQRDDNGEGDWKDWFLDIPRLISKEYGFIQWLVDNDKINEFMITEIMINSQRRYTGTDKTTAQRVDNNCSDLLLMLLSIQDNPIEWLCEILK